MTVSSLYLWSAGIRRPAQTQYLGAVEHKELRHTLVFHAHRYHLVYCDGALSRSIHHGKVPGVGFRSRLVNKGFRRVNDLNVERRPCRNGFQILVENRPL